MNNRQLHDIKLFSKKYYLHTGSFHAWDHILLTKKSALKIAKEFDKVNEKLLEAACYLHDIGRKVKDEGHSRTSAKIATPYLKKIGVKKEEIEVITDAIVHHDKDLILQSKTKEARVLFDADKLQILTVYGFIRALVWLIEERHMYLNNAISFLWKYNQEVRNKYIYSTYAKKIIDKDATILKKLIKSFWNWQK